MAEINLTDALGTKRITWLDTTRGLAFLGVIYVHIHLFDSNRVMDFMNPYFLTMFFFVSGYLFKSGKSFGSVFEQRTRTLFIPQFLFGLYTIGLQQIHTTQSDVLPFWEYIMQLFWHCTERTGGHHGLWFVAALYAFSLVFYWLRRWCKDYRVLLGLCGVLFVLNCIYAYYIKGPHLPWYLHEVGFGCFYMALGVAYKESWEKVLNKWSNKSKFAILALLYIAGIYLYGRSFSYSGSPIIIDAILITLLGIYICTYGCKYWLHKSKFLNYVGSNTLLYFGFHHKILVVITALFAKFYTMGGAHSPLTDECFHWLDTFIIALLIIIPTYIVNRWLPWVTGKGFKLWKTK